ncbi:MAG: SusD/RagB family nutrient-binding outer membrane lipoprotein [Cyclobacteriaceae bacterium]|nr:SusD/RagB family nutrient-binding outer membrane lipoprotein [Cyclobacteriaceae bacterium]MCB0500743.1 SusD/RagB family nutrient-binding outer membrane lipoprotein [Cyclobacteriaceae bacterium]MCB9238167.1 SusD/RagB family nutrient-binding outer membrane lipoprotein [Flammeovirgaceae bacterium]MCO5272973.1 SusD/RagB family nutrient-binding outer membrane lipoprotein [Cyclobacteriaceae bacterium]MCW5901509.1 SusD/RagB family nutrient-binding outer membrane lipoprotein [Cyclobacteriaceae bacte
MKRIRKYGTGLLMTVLMLFTVSSCDLTELDINQDPNNPAQASLDLLLTNVELNASSTFAGNLNDATMGFLALTTSFDDFSMTNSSWNNTWNYLYGNPLKDLDGMIKATAQQRADGAPNPYYEGIAKTLKAYYFSLMVDLWGKVPYDEAFGGDAEQQNLAPAFEDGAAIYAKLFTLLDEAMVHFGETSPVSVKGDVIYGGDEELWAAAARSLKLRLLLQVSRADGSVIPAIQTLISESLTDPVNKGLIGDAFSATGKYKDFQFTFGALTNPDDRHPMYQDGYSGGEAGYSYFGHQFMYEMLVPLTVGGTVPGDPRAPFYFKRQTDKVLDINDPTQKQTMPCSQRTDCIYGYFPLSNTVSQGVYNNPDASTLTTAQKQYLAGFFGRDRSDPSGIPNDNPLRTTVGLYPAAGLYDDEAEAGGGNQGRGDGIFPMITSWMVKLYMIEANLALGVPLPGTDARTLFQEAMEEQFAKVNSFVDKDPDAVAITNARRDAYINDQLSKYDGATDKLGIVLKQAWFMNFGNGFEVYNTFRRTGYPKGLQTPMQRPRQFALRFPYAQDEINLNPNTPNVVYDSPTDAVFWDVLKFQF